LTEADFAAADAAGLCDDANLDLFLVWYQFGGLEKGLSLTEIATMPATQLKDFQYILSRLSHYQQIKRAPP